MNKQLISPEYWNGYDICDPARLEQGDPLPGGYLRGREYRTARNDLHYALGKVASGNCTEMRSRGDEFATELGAGTLVVVDREHVMRWWQPGEQRQWGEDRPEASIPITRPYSDYWLAHQDKTDKPQIGLGSESARFNEETAIYGRLLEWGIIVEVENEKYIQPFSFAVTKLLPSGEIHSWMYSRRYPFHGRALRMPVAIGQTNVGSRLELKTCMIDMLSRVRSIDIVYPVAGRPEKKPQTAKALLGRLLGRSLGWNLV